MKYLLRLIAYIPISLQSPFYSKLPVKFLQHIQISRYCLLLTYAKELHYSQHSFPWISTELNLASVSYYKDKTMLRAKSIFSVWFWESVQVLLDYCLLHCKCGTCFQCNFYSRVLGVKVETSTENIYYNNSSHLWILFYTFKCNTHIR